MKIERDHHSRERVLAQLSLDHGIRTGALADAVGMSLSGCDQVLHALAIDGCAHRGGAHWYRTSKPLPANPTSTGTIDRSKTAAEEKRFGFEQLMTFWSPYGR